MRKRIISILLILCVALCFMPYSMSADADVAETVEFSAVGGTETNIAEGVTRLVDGKKTEADHSKWCVTNIAEGEAVSAVIEASERIVLTGYKLYTANDTEGNSGRNPKSWTLSACNDYNAATDSGTWVVLATVTDDTTMPNANYTGVSFAVEGNSTYYQYYKLEVTALQDGNVLQLEEIEFNYTQCSHTWSAYSEPVAATCIEIGYKARTCSGDCGTVQKLKLAPVLGHDFGGSSTGTCIHTGCTVTATEHFAGYTKIDAQWLADNTEQRLVGENKYYLAEDLDITKCLSTFNSFTPNPIATLDLNGHVLRYIGTESTAVIEGGSCGLILNDSSPSVPHKFDVQESGRYVLNEASGTKIVYGGCITSTAVNTYSGGGIKTSVGGHAFIMNGGNVVGCATSYESGAGGIHVFNSKPFVMNGGTIQGCVGTYSALRSTEGDMYANGGTIYGDTCFFATSSGTANIYKTSKDSTTNFVGNVISTGSSSYDGTVYAGIHYKNAPPKTGGKKITFKLLDGKTYAYEFLEEGDRIILPTAPDDNSANKWFDANGDDFDFANTKITADIVLYSGEAQIYNVTFNSNGGSDVSSQTVLSGLTAEEPATPSKTGFTFEGWYTDAELTQAWSFDTTVTRNLNLYAKWADAVDPVIGTLVDNKTYCGQDITFTVTDNVGIQSVMAGTTPLTAVDGVYTLEKGIGTVTVTAKDLSGRTATVTVTVNADHVYPTTYEKSSTGHWKKCACGHTTSVVSHTPDYEEATIEHGITCTLCGYDIAPRVIIPIKRVTGVIMTPEIGNPVYDSSLFMFVSDPDGALELDYINWYRIDKNSYDETRLDINDWNYIFNGSSFESGYYYYGEMVLNALNGYKIDKDIIGRVNGQAHCNLKHDVYNNDDGEEYICLAVIFEPLVETRKIITDVSATVTAPVIGATPDYEPTFTTTPTGGITLKDMMWAKIETESYTGKSSDTWIAVSEDEEFASGYVYRVDMMFDINDGYACKGAITGSVNGRPHTNTYADVYILDTNSVYLMLVFNEDIALSNVVGTVTAPAVGATPDRNPTFTTNIENALTLDEDGLTWYKVSADRYYSVDHYSDVWDSMEAGEVFATGYVYSLDVYFDINPGVIVTSSITGTINGKAHDDTYGDIYENDYIYLSVVFEELAGQSSGGSTTDVEIKEIIVSATAPVTGALPVPPTFTPTKGFSVDVATWFQIAKEDYDPFDMKSLHLIPKALDMAFSDDYVYAIVLELRVQPGYKLSSSVTCKVNGKAYTEGFYVNGSTITILYIFDDDIVPITSIEATVTAPVVGASAATAATFTTTPANSINSMGMIWLKLPVAKYTGKLTDPWQSVASTDSFECGYYYACMIIISPKANYAISNTVVGTINGSAVEEIDEKTNTVYKYHFMAKVFDPLPAAGLNAVPNLKFTMNGYTLDSNITGVTVTADANNSGITVENPYYGGYYIMSLGGATMPELISNVYFPGSTAKFTYDHNYYLLLAAQLQDGYDANTLMASKVELTGYGKAELIVVDEANIVYIAFKLPRLAEPTETITVPFKTQIDLGGDAAPGKTTFELEIFDPEYMLWLYYPDFECTAEIEIDGEGTFNGMLTITGPKSQIEDFKLGGGVFVRQVKGTDEKWTYSDDVYYLWYEAPDSWRGVNEDGADDDTTTMHISKVQYGKEGYEIMDGDVAMLFKNTYTANAVTPETGDGSNVVLWIVLLMLSGIVIAGTGAYQKKKRCAR